MRVLLLLSALMLSACGSGEQSGEAKDSSLAGVFFAAMFDEMGGPPSSEALAVRVPFSQGGVSFDRPKPLRVTVDRDGMESWSLERGDFSLELYLPKYDYTVADYLESMVDVLASDDEPVEGPLEGRKVNWCGQDVTGVIYRFEFFGEPRVYEGFELPSTRNGSRFLIFYDIRKQQDWSETALATFDAVNASIRCNGGKIPKQRSAG